MTIDVCIPEYGVVSQNQFPPTSLPTVRDLLKPLHRTAVAHQSNSSQKYGERARAADEQSRAAVFTLPACCAYGGPWRML